MQDYSVYLVRCRDGSLYTGIATDVTRRLAEHESSAKGAKYLRGKGPLKLVFHKKIGNRSLASKVERQVKRLSSAEKSDFGTLSGHIETLVRELGRNSL